MSMAAPLPKCRVAILISGRGSNMAALIAAAQAKDYPAEIALVLSNRPAANAAKVWVRLSVRIISPIS